MNRSSPKALMRLFIGQKGLCPAALQSQGEGRDRGPDTGCPNHRLGHGSLPTFQAACVPTGIAYLAG